MPELNDLNLDMEVGAPVDDYERPSQPSFSPAAPGNYTFMRNSDKPLDWKATKNGDIYSQVRFTIQGGDFNNNNVFDILSSYVGKWRKASTIQDFLASCGVEARPENGSRFTAKEMIDMVEQTFGPFEGYVDWEGYCKNCGKVTLRGAKSFPTDEFGQFVHETTCPDCNEPITAKAKIKRYIVR